MGGRYWIETLGCPKNQVDSDKLEGTLAADGMAPAASPAEADLVVVNTCAFIENARQESVDTVLALAGARADGARLVVTGCMAERYGEELAEAMPEADLVAGFGVPVTLGARPDAARIDLLNLPRPPARAPWAYVKVAEGCSRTCGFCAIPSFRGPQRSRPPEAILEEVDALGVKEVVLVAQDLASYGKDVRGLGAGAVVSLVEAVAARVERTRLLYLYPSDLTDELVDAIGATGIAYFDLSLQHVSKPLLRRMRRWGDGDRFLRRIESIRERFPEAAFRTNFIVGYPGETEEDHDSLLAFLDAAQVDWCGLFAYSREDGTFAAGLDGAVPPDVVAERLAEAAEVAERVTFARRRALVGEVVEVLVDRPGTARSHREAPEIDGVVNVPRSLPAGATAKVLVTGAAGPDLDAVTV
ncbi:MAG TPA: 30S ribosomal protein S12 methylthiotransferase RimO [Acidimicrobiales bacterium]|nr:30S ribosomal protein S12 methylthiotransferase RimO [Acidimicrobiales bacterium]